MKNILCIATLLSFCLLAQQVYAQGPTTKEQREVIKKAQQGKTQYLAGKYADAIESWEAVLPKLDVSSVAAIEFNIGCAYGQLEKNEKAFEYLNKAVDHGLSDFGYLSSDPKMAKLRETSEYKAFLEKMKLMTEKKKKQLAEFPEAKDVLLEAKGVKEGEKPSLLVFLQNAGDSPENYVDLLKPIAENSDISVFIPGPSVKLIAKYDGSYGYNWDPVKDRNAIINKVDDLKNKIGAEKVYLAGISVGANTAYILAEYRPDIFPNIISFGGRVETQFFPEPITITRSSGSLKVFMVSAKQDNLVLAKHMKKFFSANGAKVFLKELEDPHLTDKTCIDCINEAVKWFGNPKAVNLDSQARKEGTPVQVPNQAEKKENLPQASPAEEGKSPDHIVPVEK